MTTSPEQIEKITRIVKGLDAHLQQPAHESRRLPRVRIRTQVTLTLLSQVAPASVQITTRNISLSGLAFVCRRMFRIDEHVAILLRIPRVPPKLILARVTFGRYIGGGFYEMGAEFIECVSDPHAADALPARLPRQWLLAAARA